MRERSEPTAEELAALREVRALLEQAQEKAPVIFEEVRWRIAETLESMGEFVGEAAGCR